MTNDLISLIVVIVLIIFLGVVFLFRKKFESKSVTHRPMFSIGLVLMVIGMASDSYVFVVLGIIFLVFPLVRSHEKGESKGVKKNKRKKRE